MFKKNSFSAVILAGGMSSRMKGQSKQQAALCGVPVVVRSMLAFEGCRECSEIIVVSRKDECPLYEELASRHGITKYKKVVPGGNTRQESAFIGAESIDSEADYVAFHDAARCLVTPAEISSVFAQAKKYKCAAACCPATDTVKKMTKDRKTATSGQPDRSELVYMQTPQIFLADLYRAAAYTAKSQGFVGTDDCSLLENAGFGVKLVECSKSNFKITTPDDLIAAEALIRVREAKI